MLPNEEELKLSERLENIFMPYAAAKRKAAIDQKMRFVHYTSANAGLNIIKTKRMWMRSTTCMADYREVQHGIDTLNKVFENQPIKDAFFQAIDGCVPGAAQEAINLYNQWWNDTLLQTHIACLSEHDDTEDAHGRLSMWRAYGRTTSRVALVFRVPLDLGVAVPLNVLFSPVAYFDDTRVAHEIQVVISNVGANQAFLQTLDRTRFLGMVFIMLVAGTVSLKHEGFHEEREWRVVYSANRSPSSFVEASTEVVNGVPQVIHKLPLDMSISADLAAIDVATLLDRVIIGPSQYAWATREAFVAAFAAAGVKDAHLRVFISGIPVRTGP